MSGRDTLSFHTVGGTDPTRLLALTPQGTSGKCQGS